MVRLFFCISYPISLFLTILPQWPLHLALYRPEFNRVGFAMVLDRSRGIAALNQAGADQTPVFFLIDYDCQKWFVSPLPQLKQWNLRFRFGDSPPPAFLAGESQDRMPRILSYNLPDREVFSRAFRLIQDEQRRGNSFLCNLTFPSPIRLSSDLSTIFAWVGADFVLHVQDPRISSREFCVFSPERFLTVRGSTAVSKPMKGTRLCASTSPDDLDAARAALFSDEKEAAEHRTIVDLIRNDLGIVSRRVWVEDYRYAQQISVPRGILWTTSSRICGDLAEDWRPRIGTILADMLPAGSITGAPKKETCRIISQAESEGREFYTGIAGVLGPEGLDSWVLIRYIETEGAGHRFRSGGGITIYSKEESEYQELEAKIALPRPRT